MTLVADRVKESSSTTGTASLTLAGAATGFQSFNTAFGLNVPFFYAIQDANGTAWEVGRGYLSGSTTLIREFVIRSSNSDAAISLSSGTHTVYCTIAADMLGDVNGKTYAAARGYDVTL